MKLFNIKNVLKVLLAVSILSTTVVGVRADDYEFFGNKEDLIEALRKEAEAAGYTLVTGGESSTSNQSNKTNSSATTQSSTPTCSHVYVDEVTKEPTCSEDGEMVSTCSKCGNSYKTVIPATGEHDYVSEVTKEATCLEVGEMTYTCSVCGDSYTEEIPLADHDYVAEVTKEATCTEAGITTFTCSVCGDSYTEEIAALGHVESEPQITKKAGLFTEGEQVITCETCGEVLSTEVIPSKYPITYLYGIIGAVVVLLGAIATILIKKNKSLIKTDKDKKSA
ncbi:MAG: hypothetical protein K6E54_06235 [Bacteroidaceae bacterium]|nr:hypothetical protein [Bacteroidaceae bacterium]